MSIKIIGFSFEVTALYEYSGKPEAKNILNTFDLIGDMVSTPRLTGERNVEYKQRLMDVSVHPGDPTYIGVVNNITRSFGYTREKALTIDLKLSSSGDLIARNPRVDILSNRIILYSDWRPDGTEVIDKEIRIYQPTDSGFFLFNLVDEINSSNCFSAIIEPAIRPNCYSTNLIRDTSDIYINSDIVIADNRTVLAGRYIIEDSITFAESQIFSRLVADPPSSAGEYSLDRRNGILKSYSIPNGAYSVSYHASNFPMEVDYSPIKIYTLNDDNFLDELFVHKTLDSGEEINSLPNTEGSEILHQLYKETEFFWGR